MSNRIVIIGGGPAGYEAALAGLVDAGWAYPCRCSRKAVADANRRLGQPGSRRYPGTCRAQPSGTIRNSRIVRLRTPAERVGIEDRLQGPYAQHLEKEVGDFVLRRADGPWAYQLAVVVDDAEQGITDIVRGADLLDSTPRQILLQRALGLPTPRYIHLPVVLDAQGLKLGKSSGALAIDPGDPLPALHLAWRALGQAGDCRGPGGPAAFLRRAVAGFQPRRVPTHDVRADTLSP